MKRCTVCNVDIPPGDWRELAFVGYQELDGERLELRNHACGSTLAIEVTPSGLTTSLLYELANVFEADARDVGGLPGPYAWPPVVREVSEEETEESRRLFAIADELVAQAQASSTEAA